MIPVIGFYTKDSPYQQEALEMKESAHAVGIEDVRLYEVASRGTWERNCQQKAEILLQACKDIGKPFLYIDADARFNTLPVIGQDWIDYDIGVHHFKGIELLSGTLYINPTERTKRVLVNWVDACKLSVHRWDQRILADILRRDDITKVLLLAPEYTWIFDLSKKYYGDLQPIITHYQASRKYKRGVI